MKFLRFMMIFFSIILLVVFVTTIYMRLPKFGKIPSGERLERIKKSANYVNGSFKNLSNTPQITSEKGFWGMMSDYFSATNKKPPAKIPSINTKLFELDKNENILVWFGHSSYFIQVEGKTILVDPVFSGHASPFSFSVKAFDGANEYSVNDIPEIDFLVITHDHWDHLDYETIQELKPKIGEIITGLGVGAHFERWGFDKSKINVFDWNENTTRGNLTFYCTPARHFSGRGFKPKKSLWTSFVLKTPQLTLFLGGDGGYDSHFAKIGEQFGKIDLAILENGQYNQSWKYIHMSPAETLQAAKDLNAVRLFPVHNSKFALANHAWDEPLKSISKLNEGQSLITPRIGEIVYLKNTTQQFTKWWETVK